MPRVERLLYACTKQSTRDYIGSRLSGRSFNELLILTCHETGHERVSIDNVEL